MALADSSSSYPLLNVFWSMFELADLRDRGVITAEEFEREKAKILAA